MKIFFLTLFLSAFTTVFSKSKSNEYDALLFDRINDYTDSLNIEKIAGDENEHIIDYVLIGKGNRVQISKLRKEYFVKTFSENNKVEIFTLPYKAKRIFIDFESNVFVLTDEEAIEISISPIISIVSVNPLSTFEKTSGKIVLQKDNLTISEYVDNVNKDFGLLEIKEGETTKKVVFKQVLNVHSLDNQSLMEYNKRLRDDKMLAQQKGYNLNLPKVITKPLPHQRNTPREKINTNDKSQKSIKKVYPYKTVTIKSDSLIRTFDLVYNNLVTYNFVSNTITEQQMQLQKGQNCTILHDEMTNEYYQSVYEKGSLSIYKIDLQNGQVTHQLKLTGQSFVENVRINNGSLYYTKQNEAGFGKLYKVVL